MIHSNPVLYWSLFCLMLVFVVFISMQLGPFVEKHTGSFVLRLVACGGVGYAIGTLFAQLMQ